ncbi:hypothetical protein FOZ63_014474, partial [Perkinsus olseni]
IDDRASSSPLDRELSLWATACGTMAQHAGLTAPTGKDGSSLPVNLVPSVRGVWSRTSEEFLADEIGRYEGAIGEGFRQTRVPEGSTHFTMSTEDEAKRFNSNSWASSSQLAHSDPK